MVACGLLVMLIQDAFLGRSGVEMEEVEAKWFACDAKALVLELGFRVPSWPRHKLQPPEGRNLKKK